MGTNLIFAYSKSFWFFYPNENRLGSSNWKKLILGVSFRQDKKNLWLLLAHQNLQHAKKLELSDPLQGTPLYLGNKKAKRVEDF